jgi:hypothetical protein
MDGNKGVQHRADLLCERLARKLDREREDVA